MKTVLIAFSLMLFPLAHASALPFKVIFLGDSLTAGFGVAKEDSYPSQLEVILAKDKKYKDVKLINAGESGSTTASGLARLRWHARSKPTPRIVVLALGANDGLRGQKLDQSEANLRKIVAFAKSKQMVVLLAGMKVPPNYGKAYSDGFEAMFAKIAKDEKLAFLPFLLKDVAARRNLNLPDGIHPNKEGYKIVTQTVLQHLKPLIDQQLKSGAPEPKAKKQVKK